MSNPEHKPGTVKLVLSYKNFTWLIPRFIKSCTCTLSHFSQHTVKHVHHFLNGKMLILKIPPCFYFILLSSLFLRESMLMNFTSKMPELARRLVLHYHHSVSPVSIYVVCVASVSHPSPLHLVLVVVLQVISSQIHIILFIFGCLIMIKGLVLCLCSGCFALISR